MTYHTTHMVPCYTRRFAIKNTMYNVSQLVVYKHDMNEWGNAKKIMAPFLDVVMVANTCDNSCTDTCVEWVFE